MRIIKHLLNESADENDDDGYEEHDGEHNEDERNEGERSEPVLLISSILKLLSLRSYECHWSFF